MLERRKSIVDLLILGRAKYGGIQAYGRWEEWQRAQRSAAHTCFNGYSQHTPESIFLCRAGKPIEAIEWSLPMGIAYVRGQG